MADPRVPIMKFVSSSDIGASADFSADGMMGAVYVQNRGPDDVYMAFDAVPANTNGDGRFLVEVGHPFNLEDIFYTTIGFRNAAGETSLIDVVGLPRPGTTGAGLA